MSPFAPLYSHWSDQLITWVLTLAAVVGRWALLAGRGAAAAQGRATAPDQLLAAARSYWRVCVASTAVFIIGVLVLALGLHSSLLAFWVVAYLIAVVATVRVLPWIGLALLAWWLVRGRGKAGRARALGARLIAVGLLLLAANVALFFVINRLAAWQIRTH